MWTLYFQQIASLGYIVIGPWAIIYNPADSYKYCFCCCLFFIARWSLLMFFGISKRPRTQGWLGEASSGLGWGEPCSSRCAGGLTSCRCPWQSYLFQIRIVLVIVTTISEFSPAGVELRVGAGYEPASLRQPQLWWPCCCGVSQKRMLWCQGDGEYFYDE